MIQLSFHSVTETSTDKSLGATVYIQATALSK